MSSLCRGGRSRTAATSKVGFFVVIVNGFQPLPIITKRSILDVATALDPPLNLINIYFNSMAHSKPSHTSKIGLFAKIP